MNPIRSISLAIALTVALSLPSLARIAGGTRTVSAAGRSFRVSVIEATVAAGKVRVGLARRKVGRVASLGEIAKDYGAVAAINGGFFDAYSGKPLRNPNHNLVTAGEFAHVGPVGCTLGFSADGQPRLARLKTKITGSLDGSWKWPDNWYAYWINRAPESGTTITIFTPRWAEASTPDGGTQIVVRNGVVASIGRGKTPIPRDGFVLYFSGGEESLAQRFRVGRRCEYRVEIENDFDGFWRAAPEAIGCGPALVRDGQVIVDPVGEGFSHPKILSLSCARSAVGVTSDRRILLVTCGSATIRQLAEIMKSLGCRDAMNLDGGASSGLWLRGKYLTSPGRAISNALLVFE